MTKRIVIRGLLLAGGMDDLAKEIDADYMNWLTGIFRRLRWKLSGPPSGPVDIIGHSLGANEAVRQANALGDAGVEVGLVVLLDPTVKEKVRYGRNRTAFLSGDFRAKQNPGAINIFRRDLDHMGLTTDPKINQYIKDHLSED